MAETGRGRPCGGRAASGVLPRFRDVPADGISVVAPMSDAATFIAPALVAAYLAVGALLC